MIALLTDERVADLKRQNAVRVLAGEEPIRMAVLPLNATHWKVVRHASQMSGLEMGLLDYERLYITREQTVTLINQLQDAGCKIWTGSGDQLFIADGFAVRAK